MPPRGAARGRSQAPPDPPTSGRGTPTRGRSVGRGARWDGARTAEASPQPRGSGSPRGRGEETQAQSVRVTSAGHESRGGSPRGRGEGSTRSRSTASRPSRRGPSAEEGERISTRDLPVYRQPKEDIKTIGVRRSEYGLAGRAHRIRANAFPTKVSKKAVYQYDVEILTPETFPSGKQPSTALNVRLVRELQHAVRPDIFDPPAVYDGQRKLYTLRELDLKESRGEFIIVLDAMAYTIRLRRAGEMIDTSVLLSFIKGTRSFDTSVINGGQALNVALRMAPLSNTTLSVAKERRIFYTAFDADELRAAQVETADLSFGVVLWRGYFQSLRPALDRIFVNVDVSTGAMYRPGGLIQLACDYLKKKSVSHLSSLSNHDHERFARFIAGLRVEWKRIDAQQDAVVRSVKGLSRRGADQEAFTRRDGQPMTVAEYFLEKKKRSLEHPSLPCVKVGNVEAGRGALLPLELCSVVPGQLVRTALHDDVKKARRKLSVRPPAERLQSIHKGLQVLGYGQSDYVRQFGVSVDTSVLSTIARVLEPPTLKYRSAFGGQERIEHPRNGTWNMRGKHFYKPAKIDSWVLVSYVPVKDLTRNMATEMVKGFVNGCKDAGIEIVQEEPTVTEYLRQDEQLDGVEKKCIDLTGRTPSLFFVVIPNDNEDPTYKRVKHWGDVERGIPTQCIKLRSCSNTKPELWSNITHKINLKLGGINVIVDHTGLTVPGSVPLLGDIQNATVVMGGTLHPSYAAVVSSVDAHASKYVAEARLQDRREEMIQDLHVLTGLLLSAHMRYRRENEVAPEHEVPQRLIFYRDGVSENQFKTVLDQGSKRRQIDVSANRYPGELPLIKKGCDSLNINPKITLVVVSKRHHMRFFDEQKNCQSGTVIDRDVVHPTEFDFYLQSHGQFGERATSRATHYSVLYDENNLTPDQIQALSFALCHVYSRSPTAVSIPAPTYYAHRVCDRMRIHFDPKAAGPMPEMSDKRSPTPNEDNFEAFANTYKELHANHKDVMYFV